MFTLNDLPFDVFSIVILLLIPGCLVVSFKSEKKQPGNPMNKIIGFGSVLYAVLFLKRYSEICSVSANFFKITNVIFWILASVYFVAIIVGLFLAHNRGYGDKELLKRLKPLFTGNAAIAVIGLILVLVGLLLMRLEG